MTGRRIEKVNSLILETLAAQIRKLDPGELGLLNVSSVDTSPDLRESKVHVTVIGKPEKQQQVLEFLQTNKSKLQASLAKLELKFTPLVTFKLDTGPGNVERIEALLRKIHGNRTI